MKKIDITGNKYGKLFVLQREEDSYWKCLCECGRECIVRGNKLKSGHTRSCGCLREEVKTKHGLLINKDTEAPRIYRIWSNMIQRCSNRKSDPLNRYVGRGIIVCDRWKTFSNFLEDMGEAPDGKSIDRYPNRDGNYEPGNCRWATHKEQSENSTNARMITYMGETHTIAEWCRRFGLIHKTVSCRLNKAYPLERVFSKERQYSYGIRRARGKGSDNQE